METIVLKNKKTSEVITKAFDGKVTMFDAMKFLSPYGIKLSKIKFVSQINEIQVLENEEFTILLM